MWWNKKEKHYLYLTYEELRVVMASLIHCKNKLIRESRYTDCIVGGGYRDLIGAGLAGQLEIEPRLEGLGHLAADFGCPGLLGQVRRLYPRRRVLQSARSQKYMFS